MSIEFPTHTLILMVTIAVLVAIAAWLTLSESLRFTSLSPHPKRLIRLVAAVALGLGLGISLLLGANPPDGNVLGPGTVFGLALMGVLMGVLPVWLFPSYRQLVLSIPTAWLVGLHILRIEGGYFLTLLDQGLLPREFAFPAGYGDIAVAILSGVLLYCILTRRPGIGGFLLFWNLAGFLDFASAFITGGQHIAPFAAQRVLAGYPVDYLNLVLLIPSFVVPILAVTHIYTLVQLRSGRYPVRWKS